MDTFGEVKDENLSLTQTVLQDVRYFKIRPDFPSNVEAIQISKLNRRKNIHSWNMLAGRIGGMDTVATNNIWVVEGALELWPYQACAARSGTFYRKKFPAKSSIF